MIKSTISFVLLLTVILGVAFGIHSFTQDALKIGSFEKHLVLNYFFNYILTIGFFIALILFDRKKSDQLGFVFLASSLLKLILFLIILYPGVKSSTGARSVEFASFFVPYGISVLAEILFLMRTLRLKN